MGTIKTFPTLYTLDNRGKIRVFDCKVDSGMYSIGDSEDEFPSTFDGFSIITQTGLLDGKMIPKFELVKSGKQKRTVKQQAIFQAEALYSKKQDEGYKSIDTLRRHLPAMSNLAFHHTIEQVIKEANMYIPNWCTTNRNFDPLPMLAHKYKDIKKPKFPYFIQPKLNGVRTMIPWDAQQGSVKLVSRGGTYYQVPHIQKQCRELLAKVGTTFILDGELYKHGVSLQDISGAARTEEDKSGLFPSNSWLEYHVYDVITPIAFMQKDRMSLLQELKSLPATFWKDVHFVDTTPVEDETSVMQFHDHFVAKGYEGAILRDWDSLYEFNQRSKSLLKVKQFLDEEFEIIGNAVDSNKTVGESFVFILRNNINNETFEARPTGTIEQKEQWYNMMMGENPHQIIGKKATIRFFERSKDGIPTMGHLRSELSEFLHIRPDHE